MKNLASYGNGGAVVTNDLNLVEYARAWREHGKSNHAIVGTNSRMSEIDCAQMMVKTKYIDQVFLGEATAEEAMPKAVAEIDPVLAEWA